MIFNFTTKVKKGTRSLISIPYKLCKAHGLNLGDVILTNILGHTFFALVTGTNSSKRFTVPLKIYNKLPFKQLDVQINIIQKRIVKTSITNGKLDLYHSLPDRCKQYDWPLAVVSTGNKLRIWSPQAYAQIIPRYLDLNKDLFEVFGLIQGEGNKKTPVGGTRIGFVNSDVNIINRVLGFFEQVFDIKRSKWSSFINYVHTENKGNKFNGRLINYWSKETGIPEANFKRVNYLQGKGVRAAELGVLHIFIPSCVLGNICLSILGIIEKLSVKNEKYASWFLRGLMAADGFVTPTQYKHYKTIGLVGLALETEHERIMYSKVLNLLDLNIKDYSKDQRKLCITGWEDFCRLARINVFEINQKRHKIFTKAFLNCHQTRMICKYLSPLLAKSLTVNQLARILGLVSEGSLHITLKVHIKRGFIKRKKRGKEYEYQLTKQGRRTLNLLHNMSTSL